MPGGQHLSKGVVAAVDRGVCARLAFGRFLLVVKLTLEIDILPANQKRIPIPSCLSAEYCVPTQGESG